MEEGLSAEQLSRFEAEGFVHPVVLAPPARREFLHRAYTEFRKQVSSAGAGPWADLRFRSHLFLPWLNQLLLASDVSRNLVASARQVLKSDELVIWSTDWVVKDGKHDASDPSQAKHGFFSWHQDSTYSGFNGTQAVTFWIAFADVIDEACGPIRFRAGSHRLGQLPHATNLGDAGNMLAFGQCIEAEAWNAKIEHLREETAFPLRTGEASIHDFSVAHASDDNLTSDSRIGLAVRVVRADAFAQISKFAKRSASGFPERVSPLSCPRSCDFEALRNYYADTQKWCFEVEPRPCADAHDGSKPDRTTVSDSDLAICCLKEWRVSMERENSAYFEESAESPDSSSVRGRT